MHLELTEHLKRKECIMKTRLKTLPAVLAATMLAVSAPALAETPRQAVAVAAQTRVSPEQAIATAQKQVGGQATEIKLKDKYGTPAYEVDVRNGNQEHSLRIDAVSGQVLGSKVETKRKPAHQAAISLERAMQIALGKVNGRVMEAERDNNRDQVVYKVKVLATDNVLHKVVVDANNGNVLASNVDHDD